MYLFPQYPSVMKNLSALVLLVLNVLLILFPASVFGGTPVVEVIADGLKQAEGPAVNAAGDLTVCDVSAGIVWRVNPQAKTKEIFYQFAGKPNGATFGSEGQLLLTDSEGRHILSVDPQGKATVISPEEPRLNSPNDLTVGPDGSIYFTDPAWAPGSEKTGQHVWRLHPGGNLQPLQSFQQPNGIKAHGDLLYVAEGATGVVYVKNLTTDGAFEVFAKITVMDAGWSALDGLDVDADGNVYVAVFGKGYLAVFDPKGAELPRITLPAPNVTNLEFSPDGKTLYVTEGSKNQVYRITSFR